MSLERIVVLEHHADGDYKMRAFRSYSAAEDVVFQIARERLDSFEGKSREELAAAIERRSLATTCLFLGDRNETFDFHQLTLEGDKEP